MFVSLLLLVALSLHLPPVGSSASPLLTFEENDPITGNKVRCDRCPPGTYLRQRCSSTQKSECAPCPDGSFTELWNHIRSCLRCKVCGHNQLVKSACRAAKNCQCQCKDGFYFRTEYDMCVRHTQCPAGSGAVTPGSAINDTVCEICSNGTFSDVSSADRGCTEHRRCNATQQQVLLRGAAWHDNVCVDCQQVKDGAIYLKEILPAFLVHQQMTVRRLRRIALRLPSKDGKRPRVSELDSAGLHQLIVAWAESATASQIRQLPAILTATGATGAADKLESKLERIDATINVDCGQGNEVLPL